MAGPSATGSSPGPAAGPSEPVGWVAPERSYGDAPSPRRLLDTATALAYYLLILIRGKSSSRSSFGSFPTPERFPATFRTPEAGDVGRPIPVPFLASRAETTHDPAGSFRQDPFADPS